MDIALCIGFVFGKMQNEKKVVIIRIDTSVLILLENSLLIEFMKSIPLDNSINIVECWIDIILPDSDFLLNDETC